MDDKKAKYYMSEFEMLTNAHFQISQQITTFFQYSLLIFSAPFALLAISNFSTKLLSIVFIIIGFVGQLVMLYLSKMRAEALLYARQINRIRSIVYTSGLIGSKMEDVHNGKVLFAQDKKPDYADYSQFGYIVLVLAVFSACYFTLGAYKIIQAFGGSTRFYNFLSSRQYCLVIPFILSVSCSIIAHKIVSIQSENGSAYFRRIIGVDIDGVLNEHEEQFVRVFNGLNEKKQISAEDIVTLPVSDSGVITKDEERQVFMKQEYWTSMPAKEGAAKIINNELHNVLGYVIHIYTFRDWALNGEHGRKRIKGITKKWLKEKNISYNKLRFESGNYDHPVTLFAHKYRTRYYYAQKYKIRFFVEDNVNNAIMLSKTCEYVFLMEHKYNVGVDLPFNVIRVRDWREIYDCIKKLN